MFNFNSLATISTILILFISSIVASFSMSYLKSDKRRNIFLAEVFLITLSLVITFLTDNIFLMCASFVSANLFLVLLMMHKSSWKQAKKSAILALKNFTIGFFCLLAASSLLAFKSNSQIISEIVTYNNFEQATLITACSLILIAILCQCAIWPFHSWLLSSLNSPTPASALMHAGLVNGGGIIFAKFAPLFLAAPQIMTIAFILGIFSAIAGTLWKLIQGNVKAMLACSTVSQMGFMIAQCSMGLFSAAIAHLMWHGMFKSYLFLSSPSAWQERRLDLSYPPKISSFVLALFCGLVCSVIFITINQINVANFDTNLVLVALCFIASSQVALTLIDKSKSAALTISCLSVVIYSLSMVMIERILPEEYLSPQHLNFWHLVAIMIFLIMWLAKLFITKKFVEKNSWLLKFYMKSLNASQPLFSTITSNRNNYNFK